MTYTNLIINFGSTSTKIALYTDETQVFMRSVDHETTQINKCQGILEQLPMRREWVEKILEEEGVQIGGLSAVMARGGLLPNVQGGAYVVNENMIEAHRRGLSSPHAANLACIIAYEIAKKTNIGAYIYDCVTADEMEPIAKITGLPNYKRQSMCHLLNQRAVGRKVAKSMGKEYEDMNLLIAHLGGGVTIGVHKKGRLVDCIRDDAGPFAPERSGGLPLLHVIDMCYEGNYTHKEMVKKVRGMGGIKAYLGTADLREVEAMIESGNQLALDVYQAQAYQIAKGIGEMAPVINSKPDCIILTGGMAYSENMTKLIIERVEAIAPVVLMPGENEMEALNQGALRILKGEEKPKMYRLPDLKGF